MATAVAIGSEVLEAAELVAETVTGMAAAPEEGTVVVGAEAADSVGRTRVTLVAAISADQTGI